MPPGTLLHLLTDFDRGLFLADIDQRVDYIVIADPEVRLKLDGEAILFDSLGSVSLVKQCVSPNVEKQRLVHLLRGRIRMLGQFDRFIVAAMAEKKIAEQHGLGTAVRVFRALLQQRRQSVRLTREGPANETRPTHRQRNALAGLQYTSRDRNVMAEPLPQIALDIAKRDVRLGFPNGRLRSKHP